MTAPLVSVCMITWNHRRYIQQAMESILAQDAPFDFELVIGDDHSTDGTSVLVDAMAQKYPDRVVVVRGQSNLGMHENASRCFRMARGKYIAICEGDDYWHDPLKLRDQIAVLEDDPGMTLCHSDFDRLTRLHRRRSCHRYGRAKPPRGGDAYESLLKAWGVMSATAVYRAAVLHDFEAMPLANRRWPFADYNRLLYAAALGRVGYVDRSTATFRKIRGSAGNQGAAGALRIQRANLECIEAFMNTYPPAAAVRIDALEAAWKRIGHAAFWAGQPATMDEAANALHALGRPNPGRWKTRQHIARIRPLLALLRALRDGFDRYVSALPR